MDDREEKQEIIIVRRVAGGEEGHHGGAWKIAFADFMTAMMALFLVLWLVNAANEKTKKAVASYFNPVKLTDRQQSSRGLEDVEGTGAATEKKLKSNSEEEVPGEKNDGSANPSKDSEFFEDPFAVMDGLAKVEQAKIEDSATSLDQMHLDTAPNEDAFHDPFAQSVSVPPIADSGNKPELILIPDKAKPIVSEVEEPQVEIETEKQEDKLPVPKNFAASEQVNKENDVEEALDTAMLVEAKAMLLEEKKLERTKKLETMAEEVLSEIKVKLVEKLGENEQISDSLSVKATRDGILISITDQLDFSMFRVGSAVPTGAIILAMEEISSVLKIRKGMVRVYGHTDARPYSGKGYDNWRLSTARGHAARLMLIRGEFEGGRISQVVGFADRRLRVPSAPQADANRRIEILLEVS